MQRKSEKRRQDIINTARDLFAEKGYHSTKISDITSRLKMAHGTFYIYFQSKAEIFSDIVETYIKRLNQIIINENQQITNISEFRDFVQRLGEAAFGMIIEDQKMAHIIFFQVSGTEKELELKILELIRKLDEMAESIIIEGINNKFLKASIDTEITAKMARGMIIAGINDIATNPISFERKERWINAIIRMVLDGLT